MTRDTMTEFLTNLTLPVQSNGLTHLLSTKFCILISLRH